MSAKTHFSFVPRKHISMLFGSPVTNTKFQATSSLNQLEAFGLHRPTKAQSLTKAMAKAEPKLASVKSKHDAVQRPFDAPRKRRAVAYSGYIENVECQGLIGGVPAITLWHENQLDLDDEGNALIPYSSVLVAIDGETQTEARYILRERAPETGDNPIAVTLYHGISVEQARQIVHDYNHYATPISEARASSFNSRGPLSEVADAALDANNVSPAMVSPGAGATKKTVIGRQQVMLAVAGYALNGAGLERTVSQRMLSEMNRPDSPRLPMEARRAMTALITEALQHGGGRGGAAASGDKGWRFSPPIECPPMLWQVAGVKLSQGRTPASLRWDSAMDAYNSTKTEGRGGARLRPVERLSRIAAAM
jgi:hypothetical protein